MALIYPSFCIRLVLNCDVCPVPWLRALLRCSHVEIKKKNSLQRLSECTISVTLKVDLSLNTNFVIHRGMKTLMTESYTIPPERKRWELFSMNVPKPWHAPLESMCAFYIFFFYHNDYIKA